MRLPKQLPSVERKSDRCASVPVGAGVRPTIFATPYFDIHTWLAQRGVPAVQS
jgi:hypothetical protein